ncbi:toxin ParE1/3/4 [Alteromonadaceae bacterium Bs31]|nr:toxin ParE1/3/4 [Alteromonadaceae bacterium Bs31]
MLELEVSTEAENDLLETWLYIAEDQPINADRYLDKLQEKAQKLAEYPDLGRDRPELAEGLKSFPVDRYNLYYTATEFKLTLVPSSEI